MREMKQSKLLTGIAIGVGVVFLAMLIFRAGVFVGMEKARYSYRWGENYQRNFGGPPRGFFGRFSGRGRFIGGHGAFGPIIKKNKGSVVVSDRENAEKVVAIDKDTRIIRGREVITIKELKLDDRIAVIGQPDKKGVIQAKLIRVFDGENFPSPSDRKGSNEVKK